MKRVLTILTVVLAVVLISGCPDPTPKAVQTLVPQFVFQDLGFGAKSRQLVVSEGNFIPVLCAPNLTGVKEGDVYLKEEYILPGDSGTGKFTETADGVTFDASFGDDGYITFTSSKEKDKFSYEEYLMFTAEGTFGDIPVDAKIIRKFTIIDAAVLEKSYHVLLEVTAYFYYPAGPTSYNAKYVIEVFRNEDVLGVLIRNYYMVELVVEAHDPDNYLYLDISGASGLDLYPENEANHELYLFDITTGLHVKHVGTGPDGAGAGRLLLGWELL